MPLRKWAGTAARVELTTSGEWVEIKDRLGLDDERAIQQRIMDGAAGLDEKGNMLFRPGTSQDLSTFAVLERAIVRWSFKERITPESLRCLEDADVELIGKAIDKQYPKPLSAEQGNASGEPGEPSPEAEAALPQSSTSS